MKKAANFHTPKPTNIRRLARLTFISLTSLCLLSGLAGMAFSQGSTLPLRSPLRIDPREGRLNLTISLTGANDRIGSPLPVELYYSSAVWDMGFVTIQGQLVPHYLTSTNYDRRGGWSSSLDAPTVTYDTQLFDNAGFPWSSCDPESGPCDETQPYYIKKQIVSIPGIGTHDIYKDEVPYPFNPQSPNRDNTGWFYSVDGSRIKYDATNRVLYLPDGSTYSFGTSGQVIFTDRNGNQRSYDNTTRTWTDTLGRVYSNPLQNQFSIPSQPTDQIYGVAGLGVSQLNYVLEWRQLADALDVPQTLKYTGDILCTGISNNTALPAEEALFHSLQPTTVCANIDPANPDQAARFNPIVLAAVVLPNGARYNLKYSVYGDIEKVQLPEGGYERYEYATFDTIEFPWYCTNPFDRVLYRKVIKRMVSPSGQGGDEITTTILEGSGGSGFVFADGTNQTVFTNFVEASEVCRPAGSQPFVPYGFIDIRKSLRTVKETRSTSATGTVLRRTLTDYSVSSQTYPRIAADSFPQTYTATRDPRVEGEIGVIIEPGEPNALLTLRKFEYESNVATTTFKHLNVTKVFSYDFAVVDAGVATTADYATLAAYFNAMLPFSTQETDYFHSADYDQRNMTSMPSATRLRDVNGVIVAHGQILYDEAAYPIINYGSATGWTDPLTNARGNPTTNRTWDDTTGTWIETHAQFDNFGNQRKTWDSSGDPSRFIEIEYDPVYQYAFPTRTIAPAPDPSGIHGTTENSEISRVYDFNTGLLLSVTDNNEQTATTEYDFLLRPIRINPPVGGSVSETIYNDTPGDLWVKSRQQIDENNWVESTTFYDGVGRAYKARTKDLQGDVVSQVRFDSFGRVEKTSNPYRVDVNGNPTEPVYWSKPRYDELNRVVETFAPALEGQTGISLGTVKFGISTEPNLVGAYVVATDASGRKSRAISGTYGLLRVDEATGKGGTIDQDLGTLANPTQPTFFSYNTNGELTKITQGSQNRYFMYDALGRLIRVRQPEQTPNPNLATSGNPENNQWTAGYTYDVLGNVVSVTDAKNITITNFYDKAGRTVRRTYSDGTPEVEYFYDGKGLPQVPAFSKGALTRATSSISEARFTSFDNHGRLLASQQITDGQTYNFSYKYNLSGALIEETYPSGRIVRNILDTDGGLNSVTTTAPNGIVKTLASDFDYSATGGIRKLKLGNGLWETTGFNELDQLTQVGLGTTQTNNDLFRVNYEYGELSADGTTVDTVKNIGNIGRTTTTIPTTSFVQTFKYDAVNRLTEARETTNGQENWKQTFGYDRFGNRTQFSQNIGSTQLAINNITHPTVDQTNNRFTTGQGYVYDFNGNLIQDAEGRSFTFNGDDRQTEVRDAGGQIIGQYFYDGSGARVKKVVPSTGETTIFVYDAGGALAAEYSTAPLPSNPTTSYLTTDHLGSPRVITDGNGQVISRRDFMPFGEELGVGVGGRTDSLKYSVIGSDRIRQRFTGYERDIESDLDFAEARMYNFNHGRFTSPDDFKNDTDGNDPQSWNLYIYVRNKPLLLVDPTGEFGDYYERGTGRWVGTDGIDDDKVYVAEVQSERVDADGVRRWTFSSVTDLQITHTEFLFRAGVIYGESSAWRASANQDFANELNALAYVYQRNQTAFGHDNAQAYSYWNTHREQLTDKMKLANLAIINEVQGGPDPSNGATMWDGTEQALFPASERRTSVPAIRPARGTWELHQNTMGWSISNQDYATWRANVGSAFKAPQNTTAVRGTRNAGRTRLYSTAVYGRTIFWRVVP